MMGIKVHPGLIITALIVMLLLVYRNISCNTQLMEAMEDKTLASTSATGGFTQPNLAPKMEFHADRCKEPVLWGNEHQGGWWICKDPLATHSTKSDCLVYSYGLGADWSFDNAAELAGCEVHGFDPTGPLWRTGMYGRGFEDIDYSVSYPSEHKHFHNWGIGAADKVTYPPNTIPQDWPGLGDPPMSFSNPEPWETRSVQFSMSSLGHGNRTLSVLKIDVEGAEWDALISFLGNEQVQERIHRGLHPQLLLEYHWDPQSTARNGRNANVMKNVLDLGYLPWRVERHKGSDCCLDVSLAGAFAIQTRGAIVMANKDIAVYY